MSTLTKYLDLKKKIDGLQQKAAKSEGALEQVTKQLKEEFGCTTLEDEKKRLRLLKKQKQKIGIELKEAIKKFGKKWNNKL